MNFPDVKEKKKYFVSTYVEKTLAEAIPYNTCVTWFLARQYFFLATNHVRREIAVCISQDKSAFLVIISVKKITNC